MKDSTKYALAVSGGIDSMVMLHKFATLSPRPNFFVVTINHNLRKEGSADCQFVVDYCNQLGIECRVVSVDVIAYCKQNKVSEETGARILRKQVLDNLDADVVCTAHNACDNAETVLLHLVRGSGANGAVGIRRNNGKYFRPILELTRQQIQQYAQQHNVPYVYDKTNSDTKYARNFVRHKVIPLLDEINENATNNIIRFAENVAEDNAFLESLADVSTVNFQDDVAQIPTKLLTQPRPVAYRVLVKVLHKLGVWHDVEKNHYQSVIALASNSGGKKLSLPGGLTAVNDYDKVTIFVEKSKHKQTFEIPFATGQTVTPAGTIVVSDELQEGLRVDLDKIPSDAVFRTPQPGDVFTKFGGGTKPLNKYLIDKKIPQRQRATLPIIASGNTVLVVCGVEISDLVKVEQNDKIWRIALLSNKE